MTNRSLKIKMKAKDAAVFMMVLGGSMVFIGTLGYIIKLIGDIK